MHRLLTFSDHLRLIDERSTAFRAAVAAAPGLDVPIPSRPGWTLFDLVQHLGAGRRKAAAIVAAGPADAPPEKSAWQDGAGAPRERAALLDWWTASVERLTNALSVAGPDRGCWTWWGDSQSPETSGAWARRQVPEIAVHTHDVQLTAGGAEPLPDEVALDGFDDCQFTLCSTDVAWPHAPAVVDHHAVEGRSWRLRLSRAGAHAARRGAPAAEDSDAADAAAEDSDAADAAVRGTASDLVLFFYGRIPPDSPKLELVGDRRIVDQLIAWDPSV